jgi:hypothetical protein
MAELTVTVSYFSFEDGYSEKNKRVASILKVCKDEDIVSKEDKKRSLETVKKLEKELSPSAINDINILLTSLYSIALEDGYNRN